MTAIKFGQVKLYLFRSGIGIEDMDLMIASICLVHDLVLVTNNTKDFAQIPDLELEDWQA